MKAYSIQRESKSGEQEYRRQDAGWTKDETKAGKWSQGSAIEIRLGEQSASKSTMAIFANELDPNKDLIWFYVDNENAMFGAKPPTPWLSRAYVSVSERDAQNDMQFLPQEINWDLRSMTLASYEATLTQEKSRAVVIPAPPDTLSGQTIIE